MEAEVYYCCPPLAPIRKNALNSTIVEEMNQKTSSWKGFTIQVYVSEIVRARLWYEKLLERLPDSEPVREFLEWEIVPDFWFQVVEKKGFETPRRNRRMRIGVSDLDTEVGYSASDIQAGRNAGVVTGAALWGRKDLRNLWGPLASRARPDFEFQTVAELDRFLSRGLV